MTVQGIPGLCLGLIGPLPPPSGGMANQTRQLAELLTAAGATVTTLQVHAPYWPAWVGRVPVLRSLFRLSPYLVNLCSTGIEALWQRQSIRTAAIHKFVINKPVVPY